MKSLPLGTQSFSVLRNNDYLYVDKTEVIHRLITSGRVYFLSRPRRFGKSLLISTLYALFNGQKELFEGLYIYDKWDWEQTNPVLRIDFSGMGHDNADELMLSLTNFVDGIARKYQFSLTEAPLSDKFKEAIELLHQSTGRKVVILIDEYDKPIIDHITEIDSADANRKILKSFFGVFKAVDEHLRFLMLTGVSKFTKVSIFSELNNLTDITMDTKYAAICGYTQTELETSFDENIEELAVLNGMDKPSALLHLRKWYNGYSWDGETSVYNPYTTLLLFYHKAISNYWFESGSPTFLIDLMKQRDDIHLFMNPVVMPADAFTGYDISNIDTKTLLFQTGYLTIKSVQKVPMLPSIFTLGIPNDEVYNSLMLFLVSGYANSTPSETSQLRIEMQQQLREGDSEGLSRSLQALLANIPYSLHIGSEKYYHSLFLSWIKMLGFDVQGEVMTNIGRIDAVWRQSGMTIVAEIKYHAAKKQASLLKKAMKQIKDRTYFEKYLPDKIMLLAVAFTGREVGCKIEQLS
ncbi:ATPase AAA [Bacteroidia bacterium]|nr:ATPase AAA [Bacteroidia bacterium]